MFPSERHTVILSKIEKENSVTVSELIDILGVSFETVRRDLFNLEKAGQLKRVHGGAISCATPKEFPVFSNRLTLNRENKDVLSQKAMNLISENDVIAIDSGSTSSSFAHALLNNFKKLTIITYSKEAIDVLAKNDAFDIISTGGRYLESEKAFYGAITTLSLENLNFEKAFIFPSAVSLEYGIQDFSYDIIDLQKLLMKKSKHAYILADSTKFEKTANFTLCKDISQYTFVTDNELSVSIKKIYGKNKIDII